MGGERYTGIPGSPAPWSGAPDPDNRGPQYGQQARWTWGVSETGPVQVLAGAMRADSLWRVTVRGKSIKCDIQYGTSSQRRINGLLAPLVIFVPGAFDLYVGPEGINGQDAEAIVSVTPVSNSGIACARRIVAGGPFALNPDAKSYFALTDSVVSIHGGTAVVPVPALSSIPLVAGSSLTSGTGYEEYEA